MKVLIIDDELLARSILKEYLTAYPNIQVAEECKDGFEGIKAIQKHQPNLIFLDIQMPKINGFEMLELVEFPPDTIFTTAYDEYAIKAFEINAIDYLLKPFSKERFNKSIQKYFASKPPLDSNWVDPSKTLNKTLEGIFDRLNEKTSFQKLSSSPYQPNLEDPTLYLPGQDQRVVVKTAHKIKIIPIEDIHYLEASDDYVNIHTGEGEFLKNKTMNFFEKVLDTRLFARTHRSYIVNIREITRIEPFEKENYLAILKSGAKVPISKTGHTKLKLVLGI